MNANNLYILYNRNNVLDYLSYTTEDNDIYDGYLKIDNDKNNYWAIKVNKSFKNNINFVSSYITKQNIVRRINIKNQYIKKLENVMSCKVNIGDIEFDLEFDSKSNVYYEYYGDKLIAVKVKDSNTDNIKQVHYYDTDNVYYTIDYTNNSEMIYKDNQCIKYEFKYSNLSISDYLQYHKPFRITNFTTNKQYILEYDDHYITKSVKEISDPENELCKYTIGCIIPYMKYDNLITSIYPDIYNPFDPLYSSMDRLIEENYIYLNEKNMKYDSIYQRNIIK